MKGKSEGVLLQLLIFKKFNFWIYKMHDLLSKFVLKDTTKNNLVWLTIHISKEYSIWSDISFTKHIKIVGEYFTN